MAIKNNLISIFTILSIDSGHRRRLTGSCGYGGAELQKKRGTVYGE
jgi:hypothetical protein